jgi:alanine racemase
VTVALGAEPAVEVGDEVVLIGAQGGERILAEEVARRMGTINYEVTTGLLPRVRREPVR